MAALNEAQDITLYLRPLAAHFQVLLDLDILDLDLMLYMFNLDD